MVKMSESWFRLDVNTRMQAGLLFILPKGEATDTVMTLEMYTAELGNKLRKTEYKETLKELYEEHLGRRQLRAGESGRGTGEH